MNHTTTHADARVLSRPAPTTYRARPFASMVMVVLLAPVALFVSTPVAAGPAPDPLSLECEPWCLTGTLSFDGNGSPCRPYCLPDQVSTVLRDCQPWCATRAAEDLTLDFAL